MVKHRILMVCLGNICRSPMAEGYFRHLVETRGRQDEFVIDSAGTGGWHVGAPPNPRAQAAIATLGIDISNQKARQLSANDFRDFDMLLAMDDDNQQTLMRIAGGDQDARRRVALFMDFAPGSTVTAIPDPYYGGEEDYHHALDLIRQASEGLLAQL